MCTQSTLYNSTQHGITMRTRAHTHTHAHTIPTTTRPRLEHAPPMRHQATPPLGTSTRENHRNGMTPKRQNTPNPSANTHIHTHTHTPARVRQEMLAIFQRARTRTYLVSLPGPTNQHTHRISMTSRYPKREPRLLDTTIREPAQSQPTGVAYSYVVLSCVAQGQSAEALAPKR